MSLYLPLNASRLRVKAARQSQDERRGIIKALSHGQVSRRDLIKMGLFTSAGILAPIGGLNPFQATARAQSGPGGTTGGFAIPTGMPRSPLYGAQPFTQPMARFDVLPRKPLDCDRPVGDPLAPLDPVPQKISNQAQQQVHPSLGGGWGPIEGRPPGDMWGHQMWDSFEPRVAVDVAQMGASTNSTYDPGVAAAMNNGIGRNYTMPLQFHPRMPYQNPNSVWTFNGTIPPKLLIGRYGEPILFRHRNALPWDVTQNGGFGRHTISTHEHNGHHGAENDGFTGAFFFPGQFYDYHYPILLAGFSSMNTAATDRYASSPDDSGGLTLVPGDWHETMSTHWFHDHMFSFTSQNVYKGNAGMFNIYSGLDRGAEDINDGVNLRLPSGNSKYTHKGWGNLDYDVNLMLADKAFDQTGQLAMDIFNFDGFLGDVMTVNLQYRPYFQVEPRKYRFRILNASVSRFFKLALANASGQALPMIQIGNDGNLLPRPVTLTMLDQQGIAERYDIVIDFSAYKNQKVHLVNCCEHQDGKMPSKDLTLAQALSGGSADPCVGRFLEFRVGQVCSYPDTSVVPAQLIPNPDLSQIPVTGERTFTFGRSGIQTTTGDTSFTGPWGVSTNGGLMLNADYARISAAPKPGTREIWNLVNDGGGWDHPVHIHFEEGQIIDRNGSLSNVPLWERGRKDVYRLKPSSSVKLTMQFRDFAGTYMEHCHNTVHEDNAMLVRWDINGQLHPLPAPVPTPQGCTFIDPDDIVPGA
jgi:manganese oxidase